jgi:transposase
MRTITIGVDLAKQVFSVCSVDVAGRVQDRRELRREAFRQWLPSVPAGTIVAMEACSGAHHWARRCQDSGLQPRLMAAQFVAPFRKSRTAKNDRNDAEAIATAARQGNMRFVPVKTVDQQVRLSWHRVREGYKADALATSNRLRGLLAEFGVAVPQSDVALRRALADLDALSLPCALVELLRDVDAHWQQLQARIAAADRRIQSHARADEACTRSCACVAPCTTNTSIGSANPLS